MRSPAVVEAIPVSQSTPTTSVELSPMCPPIPPANLRYEIAAQARFRRLSMSRRHEPSNSYRRSHSTKASGWAVVESMEQIPNSHAKPEGHCRELRVRDDTRQRVLEQRAKKMGAQTLPDLRQLTT